ncbi:MAG: FGGY family carbohydrate kinase [Clostridia bacterium]|nr:FGGY family carbohydrate kinase [Clostridia bacterium]
MHLIGLDVGTTGTKAVVFDLEGNIKGYGFQEYDVICEKPGWAEQDPEKVWQLTRLVIRQAVAESGIKDIKALSLSVQGDAIIPVDRDKKPLHNTLLGMDYRSAKQAQECARIFGDRQLFDTTGMRPHPMNSLTKILWFMENTPEIFSRTYKFMTYADFILSRLGSEPVIDYTMASRTMAFELEKKEWSRHILGKTGVSIEQFSKAVPSGEIVGEINPAIADELGVSKRMLLVAGGHDQPCAALGAGVVEENIAIDSHGTAEVLSAAFNKPMLNDQMYGGYYPCYCHAKNGMYFTFALNHIGGILFKWYRDNLGHAEVAEAEAKGMGAYQLMETKAPKGPSSVLVLPHFNGSGTPWCDLDSKGAFLGLTMATTRHDIVKGILDSLTYELRINIETMRNAGINITNLRSVGGGAKSPMWLQIKADVTGCTVSTLKVREAACLGAALLAGTAAGGYSSLDEAVKKTVSLKDTYYPDKEANVLYNEKYGVYREIYDTLKNINKRL